MFPLESSILKLHDIIGHVKRTDKNGYFQNCLDTLITTPKEDFFSKGMPHTRAAIDC